MARASVRGSGFSLVEMMVAMLFVAILMAGLAAVFKASVSNFYTSGEKVASSRRNRLALSLLYADVESAGMFIGSNLATPPANASAASPLFYILPNQQVAGYTVGGQQQYADQLFFYLDQPLPFLGTFQPPGTTYTDAKGVVTGTAPAASDNTFTVNCQDNPSYATQVYNASQTGLNMVFMDQWDVKTLAPLAAAPGASSVTVSSSQGSAGNQGGLWYLTSQTPADTHPFQHTGGCNVLFYVPGQMVHYYVRMLDLDPTNPAGVPCLVRDQGNYNPAGFAAASEQVITENVSAFKAYLSADPGWLSVNAPAQAWAPFPADAIGNAPTLAQGWTNGVLNDFNTQLAACGRAGLASTTATAIMSGNYANGLAWFRLIPAVVRLDITTQTATQRSEYSGTGQTLANASLTRSLIIVPRNFGLPLD